MGRESIISQNQVNAAADGLLAEGKRATTRAIRDVTGAG